MSGEHDRCGLDLIALGTKTTMLFVYDLYNFPNWKTQILPKWYIMYQELLGQNHFWHVLQTCLDQRKMIFCPAQFFRVKFLLGTCVDVYELKVIASMDHGVLSIRICRSEFQNLNMWELNLQIWAGCSSAIPLGWPKTILWYMFLKNSGFRRKGAEQAELLC